MNNTYKTVKIEGQGTYEEKKSKFLGVIRHTETEEEVAAFLSEIRRRYYDASHHCYACVLGRDGGNVRSSDDREPSGTAGHPILAVLQGAGLTDCCLIVTRYFGGTLLGTGGLVRSYTKAAKEAVNAALIVEKYEAEILNATVDYSFYGALQNYLRDKGLEPGDTVFSDKVTVVFPVDAGEAESTVKALTDLTQGRITIKRNEEHLWLEKTSEILL